MEASIWGLGFGAQAQEAFQSSGFVVQALGFVCTGLKNYI